MALCRQLRILVGSLCLGHHLRSLAPIQPSVWHRAGRIGKLDVELHRRADHT